MNFLKKEEAMKKILSILIFSFFLLNAQELETLLQVGRWPIDICWDSVHNKVFVVNQEATSRVWVINGENNQIIGTVENVGNQAQKIVFNPRTNRVYVGNLSSNNVAVIDAINNNLVTLVDVGGSVFDLTVDINNNLICAATNNGVAVIDQNNNLINLIPVQGNPVGIFYISSTGKVYCLASRMGQNGFMHVIDAANGTVETSVNLLLDPQTACYNPNNNKIYVSNYSSNRVSIIQLPNHNVSSVVVGTGPKGLAYSSSNNMIYVANSGSNNISIIDGSSNNVVGTISNIPNPTAIFYSPVSNRLYGNSYNGDTVYIINPQNNSIVRRFQVGQGVNRFALNRTNQRVYATISWGDKVAIFRDIVAIEEMSDYKIKISSFNSKEIYSIDGRKYNSYQLKKGVYLLKSNNTFKKIIIY
ncbi:MAG: YncE family protein [candidate division WOR-3 bacterium]